MNGINWRQMHRLVPQGKLGLAAINHWLVTSEQSARFIETHPQDPYASVPAGTYATLTLDLDPERAPIVFMSDVPAELRSCEELFEHAHGRVLVAGLGLGAILWPLLDLADVESVLVLEKYQEVIDLVAPSLSGHPRHEIVSIARADVLRWKPQPGEKFNTVWIDIWPDRAVENLPEIRLLHTRGWRWLDRDDSRSWMGSWYARELRRQRRRERYFVRNARRILARILEIADGSPGLADHLIFERCGNLSETAARELLTSLAA